MATAIFRTPIGVTNRLAVLGTKREWLLEVIDAVAAAKADCTDNDPIGARGWRGWQMGSRRLRETHVGMDDWAKDDTDGLPSIVSKQRAIRIVVCNTDEVTAIASGDGPQNNSKKGTATDRAVDANQGTLFYKMPEPAVVVPLKTRTDTAGSVITYYLCVYSFGDEKRAELSCPNIIENGFFARFKERIFLNGGDNGDGIIRRKADEGGDGEYPILVTRKK